MLLYHSLLKGLCRTSQHTCHKCLWATRQASHVLDAGDCFVFARPYRIQHAPGSCQKNQESLT